MNKNAKKVFDCSHFKILLINNTYRTFREEPAKQSQVFVYVLKIGKIENDLVHVLAIELYYQIHVTA
jgi:hypothetical protein